MKFSKPWATSLSPDEAGVPVLDVYFQSVMSGLLRQDFVVDSGADISLAPRALCALLGLTWESGSPEELRGISPREECVVQGRIHQVQILVREAACRFVIPICFAEGDAPLLLGREGFFDVFRIQFDKQRQETLFELCRMPT